MTENQEKTTYVEAELVEPGEEVILDAPKVLTEREASTTVGTGSYVAISCTAMALLLTLVILGLLFLFRWLG